MRSAALFLAVWVSLASCSASAQRSLCRNWSEPTRAGELDAAIIDEASGLEASRTWPRLYHVNDSGDSGRFFMTSSDGSQLQEVNVAGFSPRDVEDVTLGDCPGEGGTCLFIADIGDNNSQRSTAEILVVRERESFPESVEPERRIRFRYPGGAKDAESLAWHPNGDLFVLSKTADYTALRVSPATLYRIPYEVWSNSGDEIVIAERVGEIPFPAISSDAFSGSLPTAMDISDDGGRLLVLTYVNAFELALDLSSEAPKTSEAMIDGADFLEIPLVQLSQQETIAWLPDSNALLYGTEAPAGEAPLMRVDCLD